MSISIWGLVPGVKDVTGAYDSIKQTLTLIAEGESVHYTSGYKFIRVPGIEGLFFDFKCWVGPVLQNPYPYTFPGSFQVPPDPILLGNVYVRDKDHPHGRKIDVKWLGLDHLPQATSLAIREPQNGEPLVSLPQPIKINVVLNRTFEIHADIDTDGVQIEFNRHYLALINSGIKDGRLWWEFIPFVEGCTQIIVNYGEGVKPGSERVWDVKIYWGGIGPVIPPPTAASNTDSKVIQDFISGLNVAVGIVRKQWPNAELYYVDCKDIHVYPAGTAQDISQLTAGFRVGNEGTVRITDSGWWSTWDSPVYTPGIILGNENMKWPPEEGFIGLEKAVELLLKELGIFPWIAKTFWGCTLTKPLNPSIKPPQPIYTFTMIGNSVWYVGAKDGKVWPNKLQDDLPVEGSAA